MIYFLMEVYLIIAIMLVDMKKGSMLNFMIMVKYQSIPYLIHQNPKLSL